MFKRIANIQNILDIKIKVRAPYFSSNILVGKNCDCFETAFQIYMQTFTQYPIKTKIIIMFTFRILFFLQ